MLVVDSVTALVPCAELSEMGDHHVGLHALDSQALKLTSSIARSNCLVIL